MELNSLSDVLVEELGDLYIAEQQLLDSLPALAAAAHSYDLQRALESHLEETRNHGERLKQAFAELGILFAPAKSCAAMQGLIDQGIAIGAATGDSVAIDAALIGAVQQIEHFEISGYSTARAHAAELGQDKIASLLDDTLEEEHKANKTLAKLASRGTFSRGIDHLAATRAEPVTTIAPEAETTVPA